MSKNIFTKLASTLRFLALPLLFAGALVSNIAYAHNTITGSVSPQVVAPGGTVTYTFTSDAVGTSADVIGLQITHALPAGFTYVSGSCTELNTHSTRTAIVNPAPGATSPIFGTWTQTAAALGLPAGAASCTYVVQVPAAAVSSCTPLTSNITKTAGNVHTDVNVVSGVGVIVSTGGSPALGVTKTTSTPLQAAGTSATYTIVFNNTGPAGSCPATNVIVKDTLPTGFSFASTGAITLSGGATRPTITNPVAGVSTPAWGSFILPSGSSVSLTFTANIVASEAAKFYQNNVSLTSDAGSANSGPTAAVAVSGKPAITKSFTPAFIATNDTSNMRFTLSNASPNISAVSGLAFTDTLPAGITAVNGTTSVCGGSLTITGSNALTFTGGTLAAGFSCNIDVTVTGTTPGVKNNTTTALTSTELGTGFVSNTATLTVSNTPTIAKAFSPTSIASDGTSALTFSIGNTNTTPLNSVTFTDTLINMSIASTAITGSCTVVSNSPALTVGATALNILIPGVPAGGCTVTVQVTSRTTGTNPNTASGVTSTQTPVASAASNTASLAVGVTPPPTPSVTKYFTPSVVQRNNGSSTSVLSIAITNPLSTAITGVAFTDTYPTTPNTGLINANATTSISPAGCTGSLTAVNNGTNLVLTGGFVPALTTCIYTASIKTKGTKNSSVGTYTNSTDVISYNDGGAKTLAATSATFQVVAGNGVSIGKAFSPSTIPAGSTSQLTITLSARSINATSAAFTDTLPGGVTIAAVPGLANACGGTITAVVGSNVISLSGGAITADTSCNIVVSVFAPSVGSYVNTLPIGALSVLNGTTVVKSTVAASATLTVVVPVLTINKTTSTPAVINTAGTTATYTITVNNPSGGYTFTSVSINDVLPTGFTFASNSAPVLSGTATRTTTVNPAVGATSPTWGTFSIPPSSSVAITFVADIASSVPTGKYSNSAMVTSTGTTATTNSFIGTNNTSDDVTVTTPTRILNVNKTTSTPAITNTTAGSVATYTITVNNSGNSTATGVAINDALPTGFSFASNTAPVLVGGATRTAIVDPTAGATSPTWGTFSIPPSGSVTITFNANVANTVGAGVYNNSASIATGSNASQINNYDGTLSTNTAEDVSIATALLLVSKVSNTPVVNLVVGAGTANYTITVKNNGSAAATGVIVADALPSTVPNVFSYNATTSVTLGGSPVAFTAAGTATAPTWDSSPTGGFSIAPGASLVITFTATIPLTVLDGTYNNSASATGVAANITNFDGTPAGTTVDNVIVTRATLTVDKTTSTPIVTNTPTGTTAAYSITVKNSGSGPTLALTVTDTLPTGFTYASTSSVTINGSAVAFTAPAANATTPLWDSSPAGGFIIPAGQSLVINFVANVASTVADGTYDNSASTSLITSFNYNGATQAGENVTVNSATLEVAKSANTPIVANTLAGTTATYSITVNNTGGGTATGVTINDVLPTGFTFASNTSPVLAGGATRTGTTDPAAGATTPTWGTFSIPPLGSVTITLVANVASSVANGTYNNSANALSPNVKIANITNFNGALSTTDDVTVTSAILTVTKTTSTPTVTKGGTGGLAIYTITVANTGNGAATGITVSDTLPAGFTYGSTGSITIGGVPVTAFTIGGTAAVPVWDSNPAGGFTIEDGQSLVLTFDAAIAGSVVNGTYQNSAAAAGGAKVITNYAAASSTAEDVVITNVAEFTLTKTHVDPFPISVNGVYTFTVTNIGIGATASSTGTITVSDTLPTGLTYVSSTAGTNAWACVPAPPVVTCTAPSFTLAAGATSSFTMTVAVAGPTANVVNTADVTSGAATTILPVASTLDPTTIGSQPGVNVSGFVYSDANHNIQIDSGEVGTGLTLFAKLVPAATPTGPASQAVTVNTATGAYTFPTVASGAYIIVIDDNNTLADVTPTIPATWVGTEMPTQTRSNVAVATTDLINLNFGLFNGNTLNGRVFIDNGNGAGGVANDGVLNGTELGLAATIVKLTNAAGTTTFDSTVTDASGNYTLWIPNAQTTTNLNVVETNLAGYLSTGGSVGNTVGTYARAADTTTFTFAAGTNYTLVNFADVPVNTLMANGQQSALPSNVVFYTHTFTAGSGGSVVFSSTSPAGWPQALLRDTNCNGVIDAGELIISAAITVAAGSKTCVILKETIPNGTPLNAQDSATVVTNFTYTNAVPVLSAILTNADLTTIGSAGLVLTKSQDTATPLPGSNIIYTISYSNSSNAPLSTIVINDATLSYTTFVSASCVLPLPAAITACSVTSQPVVGTTGPIKWTLTGSLQPAATGQVQFSIKVD